VSGKYLQSMTLPAVSKLKIFFGKQRQALVKRLNIDRNQNKINDGKLKPENKNWHNRVDSGWPW
jgi:hypothetical protein